MKITRIYPILHIIFQQNLNYIPNPITNPARHQWIIHGVQMDPVNVTDQQINDLAQCIGHTGIKQCLFIILIFMNDPLKTFRKGGSAHSYHPFDLACIDHRHNTRNDRYLDSGDPAVLHKLKKLFVVKE